MTIINFKSSDGDVIPVDFEVARQFGSTLDLDENVLNTVKLPKVVTTDILGKIIEWATYHKDDPPYSDDSNYQEICEWDKNFLKVEPKMLYDLLLVAGCLDIKGLLTITAQTMEEVMKGQTHEENQKMFNLKDEPSILNSITEMLNKMFCCRVLIQTFKK